MVPVTSVEGTKVLLSCLGVYAQKKGSFLNSFKTFW